jgi:transposase InsO family protein
MDGSCVRLRPERPNHVWSYDFVQDRTHDGRIFRTLNIIDEFTKEALAIRVNRKLNSVDVVDALTIARQCIAQQCHEREICSSCAARRNT